MKKFTRKTAILLPIGLLLLSCDRSPKTQTIVDETGASHTQAQPFKGETYRTADDRSSITLISPTELEFRTGTGTTLLSTYSKQKDALRIVFTKLGTQEVQYFHFTSEGIRADDGRVFYAPEPLLSIQSLRRVEAEQLAQQIAQQRAVDIKARTSTREIETIQEKTITDTEVRGRARGVFRGSEYNFSVWYGYVQELSKYQGSGVLPREIKCVSISYRDKNERQQELLFDNQNDRDRFTLTLDKAIRDWHTAHPKATGVQAYQGIRDN